MRQQMLFNTFKFRKINAFKFLFTDVDYSLFHCFVFNYPANLKPYFEFANYFKDIFNLFSKVMKIKDKKTAANSTYAPLKRRITVANAH
jgi:hypothetical protein